MWACFSVGIYNQSAWMEHLSPHWDLSSNDLTRWKMIQENRNGKKLPLFYRIRTAPILSFQKTNKLCAPISYVCYFSTNKLTDTILLCQKTKITENVWKLPCATRSALAGSCQQRLVLSVLSTYIAARWKKKSLIKINLCQSSIF